MNAIILSSGYGTRLYPLTLTCPKALLPVCHKTVIDYILDRLKKLKIAKTIIVTNEVYYPKFLKWLSEYIPYQPLVLISDGTKKEREKLGALGDFKFVLEKESIYDDVLLLTSDMIFSFSLNKFLNAIQTKKNHNWILLYRLKNKEDAIKYGNAVVDELGRVTRFEEKPRVAFSNLVAFGIYYLPRNKLYLVDNFSKDKNDLDALGDYFKWLVENDALYGYIQNGGLWIDVGDIEQYRKAEKIVRRSKRLI